MKKYYAKNLLLIFFSIFTSLIYAQKARLVNSIRHQIDWDICTFKPATEAALINNARSQFVKDRMENRENPCSNFIVTFVGTNFSNNEDARIAFQFAADIWANLIDSPIPIRINATFEDAAPGNLGSAGSDGFFELTGDGIPPNTLFPAALTEQLIGEDIDGPSGVSNDINANFNGARTDWYFGLDANPPAGQFDFVTVVLHELGHGLGVLGFGRRTGTTDTNFQGAIRFPAQGSTEPTLVSIWDNFIDGTDIIDRPVPIIQNTGVFGFPDPSLILLNEFEGGDLTINSPIAIAQNGGVPPRTFAPATFNPGSSYSHLDEATFNNTENALMTPNAARGEANHDPGPVILGFMEDMGWTLCNFTLSTPELVLEDIVISPNPFTETLTINLPSNLRNDNFNVSIVDVNGRIVINEDMITRNGEINIPNLNSLRSSLYFITVESLDSGVSFTNKIIKR